MIADVGLVCYLTRIRDADHLLHGPMSGALFECLCALEAAKAVINAGGGTTGRAITTRLPGR